MNMHVFARPLFAIALVLSFFGQVTWALAGTTGGLRGSIVDDKGAPVAGAAVKVTSASQVASATSDASGRFTFLALAPDTYTVSIEKSGFDPISYAGVSVFADNVETLSFTMRPTLKTIAKVTSRSAGDVVKSGVGQDVYSVNASAISKSTAIGGGGNLDNAYSAIASQPGVNVPVGGMGWNQNVYIRGSQGYFTGFEYDGIPVNRAFDNYNSSTESNLGLQELQVYTGGGPASNSSAGTSGFINQVIRTGTYPGFGNLEGGIATDAFYHKLKVEAGGATPDRRFSYYVGLSGVNQAARIIDNTNGGGVAGLGSPLSTYWNASNLTGGTNVYSAFNTGNYGVLPQCAPINGSSTFFTGQTVTNPDVPANIAGTQGTQGMDCLVNLPPETENQAFLTDRENIANFHFAIPRKNGLRDDIQLLWSASSLLSTFYGGANDLGVGIDPKTGYTYGAETAELISTGSAANPLGAGAPGFQYADNFAYAGVPFGTPVAGLTPNQYYQPSSPQNRQIFANIPSTARDGIFNDTGIVKLQYTHALSDRAYVRLFGYTFFSDWTQAGAISGAGYYASNPSSASPNYDLITHTAGGELQIADQVTDKHLLQLTANYTQANVTRVNNTGFLGATLGLTGEKIVLASQDASGTWTCYDRGSGAVVPCYSTRAYRGAGNVAALQGNDPFAAPFDPSVVNGAAAAAGAKWITGWNGDISATYNTVKPKFTFVSLTDEFRPNDRWLLDLGLRYENYTYGLASGVNAASNFYAQIVNQYTCWAPGQGLASAPLPAGNPPPRPAFYTANANCNAALTAAGVTVPTGVTYVHPNGDQTQGGTIAGGPGFAVPNFTASSPSSYPQNFWSIRASGTYTQSTDTVWRVSAGRFTQPPISASVQYLNHSGNAQTLWANFENLGFFSPFHNIPAQSSAQADLSLERHVRGTDMSFKLTPFYNYTSGYQVDAFIGQGFVTQVPIGDFKSTGIEMAFTKGDFNKDGWSGLVSLTYTNAKVKFKSEFGGQLANGADALNQAVANYNALANGAKCYTPAQGTPGGQVVAGTADPSCAAGDILNPYFGHPASASFDPNGWYSPVSYQLQPGVNTNAGFTDTPWVGTLVLNWRKNKLAVTPSLQFVEGSSYGTPLDVVGYDPRLCTANSATGSINPNTNTPTFGPITTAGTNPLQCDYTSLGLSPTGYAANTQGFMYIPNPQTGSFSGFGAYRNPSILTGNLQLTYDVSPRVSVQATLANIFHSCFGGSKEPWTTGYAAGQNICGYGANALYVSNFQNGAGQIGPNGLPAASISGFDTAANGGASLYPWQFNTYRAQTGASAGNGAAGEQIPNPFNVYLQVNIKL